MHDVYVAQLLNTTYAVRSNGRVITKVPSGTDCSRLLKAAVDVFSWRNALLLVILVFMRSVNLMSRQVLAKYPPQAAVIVPLILLLLAVPLLRVDALGSARRVT
jgi:hypothetical protein